MTTTTQKFVPQVEALDERLTPAVVMQQPNGMIDIYGTRFNDWVNVYNDRNGFTVVDTREATYLFETWSVSGIRFWGNAGNDCFYNRTGFNAWGWGGAGNDCLYGGSSVDYFYGGAGRDQLYGGWGANDYLYGGGSFTGIDIVVQDGWGRGFGFSYWNSTW